MNCVGYSTGTISGGLGYAVAGDAMGWAGARAWVLRVMIWAFAAAAGAGARGATWYVAPGGDDGAAGTTWATAKATIQAAVDEAADGDEVLVSNGVYETGGRVEEGYSLTNRVLIDKAVTVRSVNGPEVTIIKGAGPSGENAVRCVWLGSGAVLCGFTLTNGHTRSSGHSEHEKSGGGAWCECGAVLSNCVISGNYAENGGGVYRGRLYNCTLSGNSAYKGGGVCEGTLSNCTLSGNSAFYGGGAHSCTLYDCTLSDNTAGYGDSGDGGGAYNCTLYGCTLSGNWAPRGGGAKGGTLSNCTLSANSATHGGGAYRGTLYDCTLSANSATHGGGAKRATLHNCTLSTNSATVNGGGACDSELHNCTLKGNTATHGGGAKGGTLHNCTLSGNSATANGGGACESEMHNCILWWNEAPEGSNWYGGSLECCCTAPLPGGEGNINADPLFVDQQGGNLRLGYGSPCINAGTNKDWMTGSSDLDGRPRVVGEAVDMGAYEYDGEIDDSDGDRVPDAWEERYELNPTNAVDGGEDADGDGVANWIEYVADTVPTSAASFFHIVELEYGHSCLLRFPCTNTRVYSLERIVGLATGKWEGVPGQTNVVGADSGEMTLLDTNTTAAVGAYRVWVGLP